MPRWANTATVQTSSELKKSAANDPPEYPPLNPTHTHAILPLLGVVTSILPVSHQAASRSTICEIPVVSTCKVSFTWAR